MRMAVIWLTLAIATLSCEAAAAERTALPLRNPLFTAQVPDVPSPNPRRTAQRSEILLPLWHVCTAPHFALRVASAHNPALMAAMINAEENKAACSVGEFYVEFIDSARRTISGTPYERARLKLPHRRVTLMRVLVVGEERRSDTEQMLWGTSDRSERIDWLRPEVRYVAVIVRTNVEEANI